jgi:hypothetical protein
MCPRNSSSVKEARFVFSDSIGLAFHVISPPSNQTQYLDICVQFGAGFEYQVWKTFDDEEFFIIRSRSVHLEAGTFVAKPREPEFHLGDFEQQRRNSDLEQASMNVGLYGRFHLAGNQTNTVNNFGTIGSYESGEGN